MIRLNRIIKKRQETCLLLRYIVLTSCFIFLFKMFICDRFKSVGTAAQVNIFTNITNVLNIYTLTKCGPDVYQVLTILFWTQNDCFPNLNQIVFLFFCLTWSQTRVWNCSLVPGVTVLHFVYPPSNANSSLWADKCSFIQSNQCYLWTQTQAAIFLNVFTVANELDINVIPGRQELGAFSFQKLVSL